MNRPDKAREVRYALRDVDRLCAALGLAEGATRQAGGLLVCCPSHGDRTPSCSVTEGPDGTIRVKCFACQWSADALGLIAMVRGLDCGLGDQFREILAEGASIAGNFALEAEILDGQERPDRPKVEAPEPTPEREYLDPRDVWAFWRTCIEVTDDTECSGLLVRRSIDPEIVARRCLARALPPGAELPRWARYQGQDWNQTGHRLVTRAWGADSDLLGVRAIQVRGNDGPKRLPPAGYRAAGLVLANGGGYRLLRHRQAARLVITEGEPDMLSWSTLTEDAVLGVVSGSWTDAIAARVPDGCRVVIRTHEDAAGEKYARQIIDSLVGKDCVIRRSATEAA